MAFASFSLSNCYWNMVRPWPSPFKENQFNYCYLTRFNSAMNIHGVQYHAINQRWRHTIKNLLPLPPLPPSPPLSIPQNVTRVIKNPPSEFQTSRPDCCQSETFDSVTDIRTCHYITVSNNPQSPPPPSSIPHPAPQKGASIASENPWRGCRKLDRGWWTGLNIHQGAVMTSRDEGRWQHPQHL